MSEDQYQDPNKLDGVSTEQTARDYANQIFGDYVESNLHSLVGVDEESEEAWYEEFGQKYGFLGELVDYAEELGGSLNRLRFMDHNPEEAWINEYDADNLVEEAVNAKLALDDLKEHLTEFEGVFQDEKYDKLEETFISGMERGLESTLDLVDVEASPDLGSQTGETAGSA